MAAGAGPLLTLLGVSPPQSAGDVPIPTDGNARIVFAGITFKPTKSTLKDDLQVTYGIDVPKPFCAGPTDFVHLQGPLRLAIATQTDRDGSYSRTTPFPGS